MFSNVFIKGVTTMQNEKFIVTNIGCDDETTGIFEFTEEQYVFLKKTFEELNKNSTYGCMPQIYIERKG